MHTRPRADHHVQHALASRTLNDATSNAGAVVESRPDAQELGHPIHDHHLELCADGIGGPLQSHRADTSDNRLAEDGRHRGTGRIVGHEAGMLPTQSTREHLRLQLLQDLAVVRGAIRRILVELGREVAGLHSGPNSLVTTALRHLLDHRERLLAQLRERLAVHRLRRRRRGGRSRAFDHGKVAAAAPKMGAPAMAQKLL
mmetsp:Transcript_94229/g.224310  ORF Transcript_94229/g.224310 Transcript_94229/m.224310 type:complete len:200 (-) Transcript_94229:164-763(-)